MSAKRVDSAIKRLQTPAAAAATGGDQAAAFRLLANQLGVRPDRNTPAAGNVADSPEIAKAMGAYRGVAAQIDQRAARKTQRSEAMKQTRLERLTARRDAIGAGAATASKAPAAGGRKAAAYTPTELKAMSDANMVKQVQRAERRVAKGERQFAATAQQLRAELNKRSKAAARG
jgi:hypothetical protein